MTGPRRRGRLIALEGIDGVGKSTLAKALARQLRRQGLSVGLRHEPADRRLGALAQSAGSKDPWTGAVYFTLDRHVARPALERDLSRHDLVITDRSYFSTLAYQGSALRPRERRRLETLQRGATVRPDRVVLIDLAPVDALRRLGRRGRGRGPLERRRVLDRVARAYRSMARSRHWSVVDGRLPPRALADAALRSLRIPARAGSKRPRAGRT